MEQRGGGVAGTGRAVWFTAPRTVEVRTHEVRRPGPGEVLVSGTWSLISAGTELLVYRGEVRPDQPLGVPTAEGSFAFPVKYGYQVVGRVVEAGPGATVAPGQAVFVRHPHQSLFTVAEGGGIVTPLPEGVGEVAATFANLLDTAVNCLFDAPVRFGDVVVVHGLGIVGLFCAQLASRISDRVVGVDPVASRRARAAGRGVAHVATPEEAPALVEELSAGRGADISVEASGTAAGLQAAVLSTAQEGTVAVVSFYGARRLELVLGDAFHVRRLRIVSTHVAQVGSGLQPRWDRARRFATSLRLLPSLAAEELVTHRFPLGEADRAYRLLDSGDPEAFGVLLDLSA
jgi:2-desacetyl-2-hydroxyethyl bacteriochlorophyllide A dehydrogenase